MIWQLKKKSKQLACPEDKDDEKKTVGMKEQRKKERKARREEKIYEKIERKKKRIIQRKKIRKK